MFATIPVTAQFCVPSCCSALARGAERHRFTPAAFWGHLHVCGVLTSAFFVSKHNGARGRESRVRDIC